MTRLLTCMERKTFLGFRFWWFIWASLFTRNTDL